MRHIIVATTIGAIAFVIGGTVSAAAADMPYSPPPPPQAQVQPPPPNYYGYPPPAEPYRAPPPVAYGYPPPPPPPVYYEYAPPPLVVAPRPYYFGRHYGPIYEDHRYGIRSFGPYVARGYGRFDRRW